MALRLIQSLKCTKRLAKIAGLGISNSVLIEPLNHSTKSCINEVCLTF